MRLAVGVSCANSIKSGAVLCTLAHALANPSEANATVNSPTAVEPFTPTPLLRLAASKPMSARSRSGA